MGSTRLLNNYQYPDWVKKHCKILAKGDDDYEQELLLFAYLHQDTLKVYLYIKLKHHLYELYRRRKGRYRSKPLPLPLTIEPATFDPPLHDPLPLDTPHRAACELLAEGWYRRHIAEKLGVSYATIMIWLRVIVMREACGIIEAQLTILLLDAQLLLFGDRVGLESWCCEALLIIRIDILLDELIVLALLGGRAGD